MININKRKLPAGIQSFKVIRTENYLYVDKSDIIWYLANCGKKFNYLSRPRRFGKSILVDTLQMYFEGRKDLFEGLKIMQLEKDWKQHPVIRLDLSRGGANAETLRSYLNLRFKEYEKKYAITPDTTAQLADRFHAIIATAYEQTGLQVAILIDEYDSPLQHSWHTPDHDKCTEVYREVFAILKADDEYERLVFITGITKFTQISLFSVLNNLTNISFLPEYAAVCGITEEEISQNFQPELKRMAEVNQWTLQETHDRLKDYYDGYHFSADNMVDIYNPYSLINALDQSKIRNFWAASGATSLLPKFVDDLDISLEHFDNCYIDSTTLETSDVGNGGAELFLYQSGYLTIKGYEDDVYTLGFPNEEVKQALNKLVVPALTLRTNAQVISTQNLLLKMAKIGNVDEAMKALKSLVADVPYSNKKLASMDMEERYRLIISTIFNAIGLKVEVERMMATGRIDMTVQTSRYIYVIELKLRNNGGKDAASQQILDRQYMEPFKADKRQVIGLGIELDEEGKGLWTGKYADKTHDTINQTTGLMKGRKYPLGLQTFERIIKGKYVYVDKTNLIYELVHEKKYCFLSRPRRFGKSLLVTTLQAYFEGKRDLFMGLKMEELETDWTSYPVLHFDISKGKYYSIENLMATLDIILSPYEQLYNLIPAKTNDFNVRLINIIKAAKQQTGKDVVVLIDEYDAPMHDSMKDKDLQKQIRDIMRNFFSPLKAEEDNLHFVFLTGISKFSQLSIFSELNNITNISMRDKYSSICGISKEELLENFHEDITNLAQANNMTFEETVARLKYNYDGYHFSGKGADIYNPYSMLSCLDTLEFDSYWFSTGTPTFLIELLQEKGIDILQLDGIWTTADRFDTPTEKIVDPVPVLYQSGYLTIKSYQHPTKLYKLGLPNEEVRKGFSNSLFRYYAPDGMDDRDAIFMAWAKNFIMSAEDNMEAFLPHLQTFYKKFPYTLVNNNERHYQAVLYTILLILGCDVTPEVPTSDGRIDMVLKTKRSIYILELKYKKDAETAMEQIDRKDYTAAFADDKRKKYKVGINFSEDRRNIDDWSVKEMD